jgi:TPP-dependent pyruvate/acetoin dehydrogenase alpha subunit
MDVLAVYDATREAVAMARRGEGPLLIEAKTYRLCGHSRFDPRTYRSKEEEEEWRVRDPIRQFGNYLITHEIATDDQLSRLQSEIEAEIKEAIEYARLLPDPRPEEALEGLFA